MGCTSARDKKSLCMCSVVSSVDEVFAVQTRGSELIALQAAELPRCAQQLGYNSNHRSGRWWIPVCNLEETGCETIV